jgi:hypothetical protein
MRRLRLAGLLTAVTALATATSATTLVIESDRLTYAIGETITLPATVCCVWLDVTVCVSAAA